jgi:hypothetical protein
MNSLRQPLGSTPQYAAADDTGLDVEHTVRHVPGSERAPVLGLRGREQVMATLIKADGAEMQVRPAGQHFISTSYTGMSAAGGPANSLGGRALDVAR